MQILVEYESGKQKVYEEEQNVKRVLFFIKGQPVFQINSKGIKSKPKKERKIP
jgi:hypothetical protein